MNDRNRDRARNQHVRRINPAYFGIATGVICFVYFAVSRPVFGNIFFDIPLYLLLGLCGIVLFYFMMFVAMRLFGSNVFIQSEKLTLAAVGFTIVGLFISAAAIILAVNLLRAIV